MAMFVYCPRISGSARELVESLGARRLRNFDGMDFWDKRRRVRVAPGDTIICWGNGLPDIEGVKVLNGKHVGNKLEAAKILVNNRVETVKVAERGKERPGGVEWLARKYDHVGGNDLLKGAVKPDFYVAKENFTREFRLHSFNGKSIRAGIKVPRVDRPHAWIRSYDAGWKIDYNKFESTEAMRKLAHRTVKALGLTFGAVDIGERADGTLVVLECNRAPGLEGGSVEAYVRNIRKWSDAVKVEGAAA